MRARITIPIALLAWLPSSLSGQAVGPITDSQIAQLDSAVAAIRDQHPWAGLQFAVGVRDRVVWVGVAGSADLEHEVKVTPETVFRTASITKWMTATAVMRLAERGALDLDTPIQRYCSRYPEKRWPLTARHLLSHRGGVRHYWGANDEARETAEQRTALQARRAEERQAQLIYYRDVLRPIERFRDDSLLFRPGTRYHYSSHGYRLLGCAVRGAARKPYEATMREFVYEPAGMLRTRADDALVIIPNRARGYVRRGENPGRSRFRDVSENLAAGGHVSNAADLVRFALAWNRGDLVSARSRDAMTVAPGAVEPGEDYYGYGVNVLDRGGVRLLYHGGSQDETRTGLLLAPEYGVAIAAMTNFESIDGGLGDFVNRALEILLPAGIENGEAPPGRR